MRESMMGEFTTGAGYAAALRAELCERSRAYAERHRYPHVQSYGAQPVVVFTPYRQAARDEECEPCVEGTLHGNFLPATFKAILRNANWQRRLEKVHTQGKTALPRGERGKWRELDTCTSSDALLMNIFCFPGVWRDGRLSSLLGVDDSVRPLFGVPARVPLLHNKFDRTEVDMKLGSRDEDDGASILLVEAKLTEFDFQSAPKAVVENYRDFAEVFDKRELRRLKDSYANYQLIRNVLAAHQSGASFCVLCDARRPDLIESWYGTMRAVRGMDLRLRCKVLTWQEVACVLPVRLRNFLEDKYGIMGA